MQSPVSHCRWCSSIPGRSLWDV